MYGGYRDTKKPDDHSNPSVPGSAPSNPSRPRGLRNLSAFTQPVRTKHLLEELREVYDDIDNSAPNHPANPPEDDPLISWDKQSLPKGLEWMKPTPSKNKPSSANTIPETLGNFHSRDNNPKRTGLLPSGETVNSSSTGATDKSKAVSNGLLKLDCQIEEPTPPAVLNELDKENVFMSLKTKSDELAPNHCGILSSAKKTLPSEGQGHPLNFDPIHGTVCKEDMFTPLKRVKVDLTPATSKFLSAHTARKISSIPENLSTHKLSVPESHHGSQSGRISPLNVEPHLSLLTPISQVKPLSSTLSASKSSAFSSLRVPLVNQPASQPVSLDTWMTPAKGYSQVNVNGQEPNRGKSFDLMSPVVEGVKEPSTNHIDVLKPSTMRNPEDKSRIEEKNHPSQVTPLSKHLQQNAISSGTHIPKPVISTPASTLKSYSTSKAEMPPPLPEARKQPVKSSPESLPTVNQPTGATVRGKKSTNEQIYVNGKSYTVLSLLGRGGSSVVYLVLDPTTSNLMAIKCVNLSELDQSTYEGYLNEIKLLAQLQDSDCVIRMHDHQHCKEEKLLYVVMEKGETDLSKLIREVSRTKKVSPAMIVYYWTEMLNAVSFIHKRGTIHSDLKPANFLLVAGRLKLIDFGIASAIQADMTSVVKDSMTGTYNYISPEALCSTGSGPDGRSMRFKISYKSDVWSLGCILYNLVYGHTPFQNITHQFLKMKAIADPNHKIAFPAAPGCPQALLQAMQACLVRDPKLRPSVDDLLQFPYLGSIEPVLTDKLSGLLKQINVVAHSTQSPSDKILSIQSLLSLSQSSNR